MPLSLVLGLEESLRVLAALVSSADELERLGATPGLRDELWTAIRIVAVTLDLDQGGQPMSKDQILRTSEAGRRLGVRGTVILRAIYDKRLPFAWTDDGLPGVPASALETFEVPPDAEPPLDPPWDER